MTGLPTPQRLALGVMQFDPIKMHKARSVCRIKAESCNGLLRGCSGRECERQSLAPFTHGSCRCQLFVFVISLCIAQIELAGEQCLGCLDGWLMLRTAAGFHARASYANELVNKCIRRRQHIPGYCGRQMVEACLEFRVRQFSFNGIKGFNAPALLSQETLQRAAREEPQVRFVQQAFFPV